MSPSVASQNDSTPALKLYELVSESYDSFHVPQEIRQCYTLHHFVPKHIFGGSYLCCKPNADYPGSPHLVIQKHTDLTTVQQSQAAHNNLKAIISLSRISGKFASVYLHPNTDTDDEGSYIETFYTIRALNPETTLFDELKRMTIFRPKTIASIVSQLLRQIRELHHRGLFHGSIRPSNVFFERNRNKVIVTLSQYGTFMAENAVKTCEEMLSTTPESIARFSEISTKSDMYSLGVLILTLLTGKNIFTSGNPLAMLEEMRDWVRVDAGACDGMGKFMRGIAAQAPSRDQCGFSVIRKRLVPFISGNLGTDGSDMEIVDDLLEFALGCMQFVPETRIAIDGDYAVDFGKRFGIKEAQSSSLSRGPRRSLSRSGCTFGDEQRMLMARTYGNEHDDAVVEGICRKIYKLVTDNDLADGGIIQRINSNDSYSSLGDPRVNAPWHG